MRSNIHNKQLNPNNQSIKLDYLHEQIDEITNKVDQHYTKTKVIKKRKWFIPIMCLFSCTVGVGSTIVACYFLIESNIIHKKKNTLDYEDEQYDDNEEDEEEIE